MTRTEQKRAKGRVRCNSQAHLLEILASKDSASSYELSHLTGTSHCATLNALDRMRRQKLVHCIEYGRNGRNPKPSVWQLRETYERQQLTRT